MLTYTVQPIVSVERDMDYLEFHLVAINVVFEPVYIRQSDTELPVVSTSYFYRANDEMLTIPSIIVRGASTEG